MPTANFNANKLSGPTPLVVRFFDVSTDTSATHYLRTWNFGDGNIKTSTEPFIDHVYTSGTEGTLRDVSLTIHLSSNYSFTRNGYIRIDGPGNIIRFGDNKKVNIIDILPTHLRESEIVELVRFFQDYVNNMYLQNNLDVGATDFEKNYGKISVIEKIARLSELHDPNLMDIEYIQYYANYLGYNIDVNRGEIGILEESLPSNDTIDQEDVKRYMRFIVDNLPNWYKIKTTRSAIRIMLYSFGIIGDIYSLYTSDYKKDTGKNWFTLKEGIDKISDVPKNFYPTSHYTISINLDESVSLENVRDKVLKAIESLRPANCVFNKLTGFSKRSSTIYVKPYSKQNYHLRLRKTQVINPLDTPPSGEYTIDANTCPLNANYVYSFDDFNDPGFQGPFDPSSQYYVVSNGSLIGTGNNTYPAPRLTYLQTSSFLKSGIIYFKYKIKQTGTSQNIFPHMGCKLGSSGHNCGLSRESNIWTFGHPNGYSTLVGMPSTTDGVERIVELVVEFFGNGDMRVNARVNGGSWQYGTTFVANTQFSGFSGITINHTNNSEVDWKLDTFYTYGDMIQPSSYTFNCLGPQ